MLCAMIGLVAYSVWVCVPFVFVQRIRGRAVRALRIVHATVWKVLKRRRRAVMHTSATIHLDPIFMSPVVFLLLFY